MAAGRKKPAARKGGASKAPPLRDPDDDDEEDDSVCELPHLEPGQVPISIALFEQMLAGKSMSEEREVHYAKLNDVNFTGLRNTVGSVQSSLDRTLEHLDKERGRSEDKDKQIISLHMQIAEMVRASEDARLERDRIEASRQEKEQELTALRLKLINEREMARDEMKSILGAGQELIAGIAPIAAPFFAAWMKKNGFDVPMGVPGMAVPGMGLPQAPPAAAARPQYKFQLSDKDAERWMEVLQSGLGQFSVESASVLRGLICNGLFSVDGAPQINITKLIEFIQKDVGADLLGEFVALTQRAWKPISQEANGANGATATPN